MPGQHGAPVRVLPERVLLVRLGAIGDVVNALLVAGAIRAQAPATHIGWAVHALALPLVEGNPAVDRVHLWDKAAGLRGFRRVVKDVRAQRYDLAVDLQRIAKSALLARLAGAPRVLGFDRARSKEGSWMLAKEHTRAGRADDHVVEQYRDVVRALGLAPEFSPHPLPLDKEAEDWAESRVAAWGGRPVLVNLGASKPPNRWPDASFRALLHALRQGGFPPLVLTGGPDERTLFEGTRRVAAGADGIHDLVGATSLLQLAALARRAALMISCDTGPMHLAAATGCPLVALFGPANPARTGPFGAGHTLVSAPGHEGDRPMSGLQVEPVVAAVKATLAARLGG